MCTYVNIVLEMLFCSNWNSSRDTGNTVWVVAQFAGGSGGVTQSTDYFFFFP